MRRQRWNCLPGGGRSFAGRSSISQRIVLVLALACTAALAGCAARDIPLQEPPAVSQRPATEAEAVAVRDALSEKMRDPDSTTVRHVLYATGDEGRNRDGVHICGEINSKNAYGGYVGFTS